MPEKIVAVAFLTSADIETLGTGFKRIFPLPKDDHSFADLLAHLDEIYLHDTDPRGTD